MYVSIYVYVLDVSAACALINNLLMKWVIFSEKWLSDAHRGFLDNNV